MPATLTENCPSCQSPLIIDDSSAQLTIICSKCRHRFSATVTHERTKTSRKAVASFVLGLSALFALFVTGIPAIVMGSLALRDIRRSRGQTKGFRWAISGIVTGSLFGLFCTPISGVFMYSVYRTISNPPRVYSNEVDLATLIQKMPQHQPPTGVKPIYGFEHSINGLRLIVYADQPRTPTALVFLSSVPGDHPVMRKTLEGQMNGLEKGNNVQLTVKDSQTLHWEIAGQKIGVLRQEGMRAVSGVAGRRYVAFVPLGQQLLAVLVSTEHRPNGIGDAKDATTASRALSEQEVREYFTSIRVPQPTGE